MESLKGGQQFFSNYLKAFKETVDKQTEIVGKLNEIYLRLSDIIPKFYIASETLKHSKVYGNTLYGPNNPFPISVKSFVTGTIRLKITGKCQQSGIARIQIKVNGVFVAQSNLLSTADTESVIDLPITENDIITFAGDSGTYSNQLITFNTLKICYDLADKPNISL